MLLFFFKTALLKNHLHVIKSLVLSIQASDLTGDFIDWSLSN